MKYIFLLLILAGCSRMPHWSGSQEPDKITKLENGFCFSWECKDGVYQIEWRTEFQGRYILKKWKGDRCITLNEDETEDINCWIKK